MRMFRKISLILCSLFVLACVTMQAQTPSLTARGTQLNPPKPLISSPAGCTSNCLWYSGDTDFSSENWNALWNGDNQDLGITGQVWVPVVPQYGPFAANAAQISSVTFNEIVDASVYISGMTFSFNTGMSDGSAGTVIYSDNCKSIAAASTGRSGNGYSEFALTCTLPKTLTLKSGNEYWVNLTPIYTGGSNMYLDNVSDSPQPNRIGWGDITNESFFYSSFFGCNYLNANTQGYFPELSIGMTGKYVRVY